MPFSVGAAAALGAVELVAHGIVDDGGHQGPVLVRAETRTVRCSSPIDTQNCGKPWAKLVVPSSGSTYQRNSPVEAFAGSLFAVDAVVGKGLAETRADQLLDGAVGHGDQVDVALVLGFDALGQKFAQARAGLAGDRGGRAEPRSSKSAEESAVPAWLTVAPRAAETPEPGAFDGPRRLPDSVMVRIWCL